jgi:hypothetical protein
MMDKFWKAALTVGGLAAIGAFVFWSLYKDWLALPIFSKMSADQTFAIMKIFLWLTFAGLVTFVIAFLLGGKSRRSKSLGTLVLRVHWREGLALEIGQVRVEGKLVLKQPT